MSFVNPAPMVQIAKLIRSVFLCNQRKSNQGVSGRTA
jgi:hypothetical protein